MNTMRERAKEHFPTVLLTLLSIVQALALELLWGHVVGTEYLYSASWTALLSWVQIVATFMGLVLIWVVYGSNVTRFSWVPSTSDSVFPFLIGVLEFLLVETLGPDTVGPWLVFMAVIFGAMNWIAHSTMVRARRDKDNADFFREVPPAQWQDFTGEAAIVGSMALAGAYMWSSGHQGGLAMAALVGTLVLLSLQYVQSAKFWRSSVEED